MVCPHGQEWGEGADVLYGWPLTTRCLPLCTCFLINHTPSKTSSITAIAGKMMISEVKLEVGTFVSIVKVIAANISLRQIRYSLRNCPLRC